MISPRVISRHVTATEATLADARAQLEMQLGIPLEASCLKQRLDDYAYVLTWRWHVVMPE